MKPYLLVPIMFIVTGCATSEMAPEQTVSTPVAPEKPEAIASKEVADIAVVEKAQPAAPSMASAKETDSLIESLEAPQVEETPTEDIPGVLAPETAVECKQSTRPGSVLPVRICQDKRVIDARRAADQELFNDIKRNTALFVSRL